MNGTEVCQLARIAQHVKERAVQQWAQVIYKRYTISCADCDLDSCCYQMVVAHLYEGVLIAQALIDKDLMRPFRTFREHMKVQEDLISAHGHEKAAETWFDRQIPCPLLHEGKCLFYAIRPIACSTYCVVSPKELCGPPSGETVGSVRSELPKFAALEAESKFIGSIKTQLAGRKLLVEPMVMGRAVTLGFRALARGDEALDYESLSL